MVSKGSYGSESGADVLTRNSTAAWNSASSGLKTSVTLTGGGTPVVFDDLAVAQCGAPPTVYEPVFVDTFERPSSSALGTADFPSSSAWIASSDEVRIVDGALQLRLLSGAKVLVQGMPMDGLRLRAILSAKGGNLWANVHYNVAADLPDVLTSYQGFWIWGGADGSGTYAEIFRGDPSPEKFLGTAFFDDTSYFVQLDRDDGVAVLTVRTASYEGPVLSTQTDQALAPSDSTGEYLRVSTSTGSEGVETLVQEIRADRYGSN